MAVGAYYIDPSAPCFIGKYDSYRYSEPLCLLCWASRTTILVSPASDPFLSDYL